MADAPEANPCCVATQRQVERLKAEVAALTATAAMLESRNLATSYDRDEQIAGLIAACSASDRSLGAALSRALAAEAQRDALAEALRGVVDAAVAQPTAMVSEWGPIRRARAALAKVQP